MRYREGDWIKYRHHEGWVTEGKVLETRPDDKYVVGSHDRDPEPNVVDPKKIVGEVS